MNTYLALLRGINVGGKNVIKMERLKQVFANMGFSDVKTYIQSGNIIFRAQGNNKTKLMQQIETQLQKSFSAEIRTLVLDKKEIEDVVKGAHKTFGAQPEDFYYDVWFMLPPTKANDLVPLIRLREGVDALRAGKIVLYTSRLLSQISKSHFSKIMQTPDFQKFTVRNWNTTRKLCALMQEHATKK